MDLKEMWGNSDKTHAHMYKHGFKMGIGARWIFYTENLLYANLFSYITSSHTENILYGRTSGPRLNIKTVLSTYGDFHVKDKTAVRTSYL